jgi:hypothetical protein
MGYTQSFEVVQGAKNLQPNSRWSKNFKIEWIGEKLRMAINRAAKLKSDHRNS